MVVDGVNGSLFSLFFLLMGWIQLNVLRMDLLEHMCKYNYHPSDSTVEVYLRLVHPSPPKSVFPVHRIQFSSSRRLRL